MKIFSILSIIDQKLDKHFSSSVEGQTILHSCLIDQKLVSLYISISKVVWDHLQSYSGLSFNINLGYVYRVMLKCSVIDPVI